MWMRRASVASAVLAAACVSGMRGYGESTIDLSGATRIALPAGGGEAVAFTTPDGKQGWVRKLSAEAIPTPAYANGRIFTGGGMSSAQFYAIDAATGKTIWQRTTQDNGPTSPVVQGKYVAYNTESCHTESRDEESGDLMWSEVTGGSLLTQPVIADGMLVIPHPTMSRRGEMADDAFRMLGVDLKTGKHHWDANMTADVLAAPVAANGRVFFTCTDGRVFCIETEIGGGGWHVVANATSAPVVVGDVLAVTTEAPRTFGGATVSVRRYSVTNGDSLDDAGLAPTNVGKAFLAPGQRAEWDYQGPKLAALGKTLFYAPGNVISSLNIESGKTQWQAKVSALSNAANSLTPPALGKANVYLGSSLGHVFAVKQSDASLAFAYNLGQPLASQPLLADGNLYIGTTSGMLICLKLGEKDASDWTAWGGDAQHNKVQ